MRSTRFAASLAVATAVLTGGMAGLAEQSRSAVPAKPDDRTIVHVLNRIGFGAAPGDVARVREMGLQRYVDAQLNPERISDEGVKTRLASFQTLSKSTREMAQEVFAPAQMARREQQRQLAAQDPAMAANAQNDPAARRAMMTPEQAEAVRLEREVLVELMQAKVLRAVYSERQLEEVLVDFWFNHFNVFSGKGQVRQYLSEYERDVIRPHVFGRFRELLQATAESPAMLFYLDNWQSAAPEGAVTSAQRMDPRPFGSAQGRPGQPFRPRPRTVRPGAIPRPGQIRQPGRPPNPANPNVQAQNRRRGLNENYARELMELHTLGVDGGYTQKDVQEVARAFTGWTISTPRLGGSFHFEPRMHDDGEKVVLGHEIKAGGGKQDGDAVLDILAKHPATARFVATKLARRFVADEPPKDLVDRAAKRFRETDGNLREVVRTIVTSPEFFAAESYRAKVKTPFEFVVSAVRATGTEVENAQPLVNAIRTLGMPVYGCQPPTGYSDKADAWVNSGALLNRMNFAVSLTSTRQMRGGGGTAVRPLQGRAVSGPSITADQLVASALAGELTPSTASIVAKASTAPQALALVLGSPEFQRK